MDSEKTIYINAKLQREQISEIKYFRFLKEHAFSSMSNYTFALNALAFRTWYIILKFNFKDFSLFALVNSIITIGLIFYMIAHAYRHSNETLEQTSLFSDFLYSVMQSLISINIIATVASILKLFLVNIWPGTLILCFFEISFMIFCLFFDELKCKIHLRGIGISAAVVVIIYLCCGFAQNKITAMLGIEGLNYFEHIYVGAFLLGSSCLILYGASRITNNSNIRLKKKVLEGKNAMHFRYPDFIKLLSIEKNRQAFALCMNILCIALQIRCLINGWNDNYCFALPRLLVISVTICCFISAYYNIKCIQTNNTGVFPSWFEYVLAIREMGGLTNFYTNLICPFMSERPEFAFLANKYGLDWTVLVLVPILMYITNLIENHDAKAKPKIIGSAFLTMLIILEKFGNGYTIVHFLDIGGIGAFDGVIGIVFAMFTQEMLAVIFHLLDYSFFQSIKYKMLNDHVEHDYEKGVDLHICGARNGFAPTSSNYYIYGQASNCFVLRDANYGIIIDCGSGLVHAKGILKGCSSVDIFLTDTSFTSMMGFLANPNPCPGAKIRIFGPFGRGAKFVDMNSLAMPPLWPVNVIVGECISVPNNQSIRLNDFYSVRYYPNSENKAGYSLRINGAVSLFYGGAANANNPEISTLAKDCDVLIHKDDNNIEQVVDIAKQANVGYLLIANHSAYDDDECLAKKETEADAIYDKVDYLKQGDIYNIA